MRESIKRQKQKIAVGAIMLMLLTALFVTVLSDSNNKTYALTLEDDAQIATSYVVGDSLDVPKGKITVNGTDYDAKHVLQYPGGKTSVSELVTLSEAGEYVLEYRAVVAGKVVSETVGFTVKSKIFEVTEGRGGSARFGYYGDSESDYVSEGVLQYPAAENFSGIRLKLAENSTFIYNKAINIANLTADDSLFDFIALPENKGTADLYEMQLKFTDAYDPTNQMIIKLQQRNPSSESWTWMLTFVQAKGKGQQFTGLEDDKVIVGGEGGTGGYFAFNGNGRQPVGQEFFRICYDKDSGKLYHVTSRGKTIICDFDDPRFFGLNPWKGFSGDEIFLNITGRRFNNSPAELLLTGIYGEDLSAQAEEYVLVNNGPKLDVDTLGYIDSALPVAVQGRAYPLFPYSAADAYGNTVKTNVNVYYGYGSSSQTNVAVNNGSFTPTLTGLYTIRYAATNAFNKTTEKFYYVNCVESADISLELPASRETSGTAGVLVEVKNPDYSEGAGALTLTTTVTCNGNAVELSGDGFIPQNGGTFTVSYTVTDYLSQTAVKSYDVSVTVSSDPVFTDTIVLPKYFLTGYGYPLPAVNAKNYSTGQTIAATVSASGGNVSSGVFKATEAGTAVITYTAGSTTKPIPVKVVDGTKEYVDEYDGNTYTGIDSAAYFDTDNLSVSQTTEITTFLPESADDASLTFVNPLYANGFSLTFSVPGGKSDFNGIDLILTDYADSKVTLKIGLRVQIDGSTKLYINGEDTGNSLTNSLFSGKNITLTYSADTNSLSDLLSLSQKLTSFRGFNSGKVYMSLNLIGINSLNAGISIKEINAQGLNSLPYDSVRPQTKTIDAMPIIVEKGQTVQIARAVGMDVLNPEVTGYVTVQKSGGAYLTTADGTVLSPDSKASYAQNYSITLDEFGVYLVSYITEDSNGNKASPLSFALRVIDDVAPSITVKGKKIPTSGKVGKEIKLQRATATDNVDESVKVAVLVIEPSTGHYYYLEWDDGNKQSVPKFTPQRKGYYTVRYFAADSSGNVTTIDFVIVVGE